MSTSSTKSSVRLSVDFVAMQSTVLLQFVPVREPATTAHRTARLGGLAAIIALLHALEDVKVMSAPALASSLR
jgi:hypothetical protein